MPENTRTRAVLFDLDGTFADIEAGRAAGTGTLAALFGYLGEGEDPRDWGAHGYVHHPLDMLDWLGPVTA